MATQQRGTETKITDEMVEELQQEKGKEYPARYQFNREATEDTIRHWAEGIGDRNPLWQDREYARKTRYGGIIAPPTFLYSCAFQVGRRGLAGIHAMYSGTDWHFHKPVHCGDRILTSGGLYDVIEKKSAFSGRSLLQIMRVAYRNQHGELLAECFSQSIRTERETAEEKGKYSHIQKHAYTREELERIGAAIEREEIRGATPRYWEDVQVGEELTPVVKGPLTVSDIVAFKIGWGFDPFMRANEVRYWYMKRHPGLAMLNKLNVPDVPESVHYNDDIARWVGVPGFYDYGPQRVSWLGHLMTNWMGDDGWLKRLNAQVRLFNIEGDTQWCKGRVTGKYIENGEHLVECRIVAENQRGEPTAPGTAVVVLPSRG